jgi:thioredoxin 1
MNKLLLTALLIVALITMAVCVTCADDAAASTPAGAARHALSLMADALVQHGGTPSADLKDVVVSNGATDDQESSLLMLLEFASLLNTKTTAPDVLAPEATTATATVAIRPLQLMMTEVEGVWKLDLQATYAALPDATRKALATMAAANNAATTTEVTPPAPPGSAGAVVEATDATFSAQVLKAPGYVLVDGAATWCGWCKKLAPLFDALAPQYAGKVKFVHIFLDENTNTQTSLKVDAFPTLIMFKDGKEVSREEGYLDADPLKVWVDGSLK